MKEMKIAIFDGKTTKTRKLRKGTTLERAIDILHNLWYADYNGWSYTLIVDGAEYLTLEH